MHKLDDALSRLFDTKRRVSPQHTNRCSQAGVQCARRLQWHRTRWREASLPPVDLQRRFELGILLEPQIVRLIEDSGVRVQQSQRDLEWKNLQLTGHIDGVVSVEDGPVPEDVVLEVKTASKFSFERIRKASSASELLTDSRAYVRGYVVQGALYALLLGLRRALLFFFDKDSGRSHTLDVSLDDPAVLDAAEQSLRRFERVNSAIAAGTDLPAEPGSHCKDCPFLGACAPALSFDPDMAILDAPEVEEMVARHEALKAAAKAYEELDEDLKERFAKPGTFLIGDWSVVVKDGQTTRYNVPKEVKAPFAVKVPQLRREYVRLAAFEAPKEEAKEVAA